MTPTLIYYGGSFNPPHLSHFLFVATLGACFPDADVWVAPTFSHAFSKSLMPFGLRYEMLVDLLASLKGVTVSSIERDMNRSPSYTIDVVRRLRELAPGHRIVLAVGADIVPTLPQWREYDKLKQLAEFLVFPREGCDNAGTWPMPVLPGISSSQIRTMLANGHWDEAKKWLPPRVLGRIGEWRASRPDDFDCFVRNGQG